MRHALGHATTGNVSFKHTGAFESVYATTDFAAASMAAAAAEVAEWIHDATGRQPTVSVDTRLASQWLRTSLQPMGWTLPAAWDALAGDYEASDGWIRLHTNAPHHREAALAALGWAAHATATVTRDAVASVVAKWRAQPLEDAVVAAGGCAAVMHSAASWRGHAQGLAVCTEPLIAWENLHASAPRSDPMTDPVRPLSGIRVLDLTRVLAGPVATRFLAGYGAEVLRLDAPTWHEPSIEPEVTIGKHCASLDFKTPAGRAQLEALMQQADILVHGYRSDALERLGLGAARRRSLRPDLVDVSLSAYGHTGPWHARRGFDSLVQMSCGIAHKGMTVHGSKQPVPLPAQALDHATGYLMAAAAVQGLRRRRRSGCGTRARLSLARTAHELMQGPHPSPDGPALTETGPRDLDAALEHTPWGPTRRLRPAHEVSGVPHAWASAACRLHSASAQWPGH